MRRSPVQSERSADGWAYPCLVWGPYRGAAVMEVMESGGVPSALFPDPPGPVDLGASSGAHAIGIAGGDGNEPGAGQSADRRDAGQYDRRAYAGGGIGRSVVAGGDSTGYAARKLGLRALTALAETVTGAALFTGHLRSGGQIEIALNGRRMGPRTISDASAQAGGPGEVGTPRQARLFRAQSSGLVSARALRGLSRSGLRRGKGPIPRSRGHRAECSIRPVRLYHRGSR